MWSPQDFYLPDNRLHRLLQKTAAAGISFNHGRKLSCLGFISGVLLFFCSLFLSINFSFFNSSRKSYSGDYCNNCIKVLQPKRNPALSVGYRISFLLSANPIANIRLTSVRSDYFTVTLTVLVTPLHVTVILAVPFLIPLIVPLDDTVAIFLLPDLYVTFLMELLLL